MTSEPNNQAWSEHVALYLACGLGLSTYYRLVAAFGSAAGVASASLPALQAVSGMSISQAQKIYSQLRSPMVQEEIEHITRENIQVQLVDSAVYPERLRQIYHPPPVLYCEGHFQPVDGNALAIVGTRHASTYGISVAVTLSHELACRGLTIVSGLARGIDQAAHKAALDAGGRTIAVLGSGLRNVYPRGSERLAERIVDQGLLISEFPLSQPPYKGNFPRRNRIISGLSLGVLVVEAPQRSGALITAHYALEQGREVFAVPGRITSPAAMGCNRLIQLGAKLVTDVTDVIDEIERQIDQKYLRAAPLQSAEGKDLDPSQAFVMSLLSDEPKHIDQLQRQCGFNPGQLARILLKFELDGLVKQLPGKMYLKCLFLK